MDIKKYTEANRLAWNEAMPYHQAANQSKWDDLFATSGYSALSENETKMLESVGVSGLRVAHLCCNNGVELLSLKNLGAGTCVGFDISDEAIREAQERADRLKIDCHFVQSDIYDISQAYHGQFDLVYISIGCLGWLPDLKRFFQIAGTLLIEGGSLFIHEAHPLSQMLPVDGVGKDPLRIIEPYFKDEPYVETDGIDYIGKTTYESHPQYWFVWTLSNIIMGIIEAGLKISHFSEYSYDISTLHQNAQNAGLALPLSYILTAAKSQR